MNKVKFFLLLALSGCLSAVPVTAQQARQMARSTTAFGDSSLLVTSDTLTSKTTFVTKAVSLDQVRKALSKFVFDSVKSTGVFRGLGISAFTGVATFTAQPIFSSLTASQAVFTDGSKGLVSNAITGSGSVMMSASPTTTGTLTGAAANFSGAVTASTFGGVAMSSGAVSGVTTLTSSSYLDASAATGGWVVGAVSSKPRIVFGSTDASSFSLLNSSNGYAPLVLAGLTATTGTFNGAVSGITSLAGTGAVSGFTTMAFSGNLAINTNKFNVVAATGAFSSASTYTSSVGNGGTVIASPGGASTGAISFVDGSNTGGRSTYGLESSTGGTNTTGSSAYAVTLVSFGSALELGSNNTVRLSISSAGAFNFKSNPLSSITTISASGTESLTSTDTSAIISGHIKFASDKKLFMHSDVMDTYIMGSHNGGGNRNIEVIAGGVSMLQIDGSVLHTHEFYPSTDNAFNLGSTSFRWAGMYLNASASGVGDTFMCLSTTQAVHQGATCAASTRKIKENIKPITNGLTNILALTPSSFTYQKGFYGAKNDRGFIAEEAAKINPTYAQYAVQDEKLSNGQTIKKGDPEAINYMAIIADLTQAVQDLAKQNKDLQARIAKLEKH